MTSQPIKCRAAVLFKANEPLAVKETLVPAPKPGQVRVKMVAAGICASDAHYLWGKLKTSDFGQQLPLILGHEGSGIVESVGDGVTDLKPGDHVLTTFLPSCGKCYGCQMSNICFVNTFPVLGGAEKQTLTEDGSSLYGFAGVGAYSEYLTIKREGLIKINPKANLEHSSVISCAVATGFYSAVNLAKVKPGSSCAVWGIGAIGLNVLQGCRFNGAKHIIAIDINPDKRDLALKFGATEFINPKERSLDEFVKEKFPVGIDYTFDCFGSQMIIDQALKCLSPFGTFTLVGMTPNEVKIVYPATELFMGRQIISGMLGGMKANCCQELAEWYQQGKIMVDELITNRFSLEQINQAFQTLKDGKCARSLILF